MLEFFSDTTVPTIPATLFVCAMTNGGGKKLEKLGVGRAADPIGDDVCLSVRPSILLSTYLSILEMT